ncbi:MAG: hypothetical protein DMF45_11340 [Verrucomicrobia bacterium]|nr:MAG: hypothetical protein DMF45_11340 [Verrucomicrobiota bacterium]
MDTDLLVGCAKASAARPRARAQIKIGFFIVTSAAFRMPGGLQTWKCLELTFWTRQRASLQ